MVGLATDLGAGVYKYLSHDHVLEKVAEGNRMKELSEAAAAQLWLEGASIVLVPGAVYERTTIKYGDRGIRYVQIEAGHAA